ncbi:MAG: DUF167 domain-containing protein [Alphaproteobacteria bacterium]|nr:DUF167 domain-containing protein [Alphaproteobacteria bacterium]
MKLGGWQTKAASLRRLTATVIAVPEDGVANKALLHMLAKECRVAVSSIQLITG